MFQISKFLCPTLYKNNKKKSLERHLPRDCVIRKKRRKSHPIGIHEKNSWKLYRLFSLKIQINLHRRCLCHSDVIPGIAVKNFDSEKVSQSTPFIQELYRETRLCWK